MIDDANSLTETSYKKKRTELIIIITVKLTGTSLSALVGASAAPIPSSALLYGEFGIEQNRPE